MGYIVWTKGYGEEWHRQECESEDHAKHIILEALKQAQEPVLTQELPFELKLTFKEPKEEKLPQPAVKTKSERLEVKEVDKSGATESKPTADQSTGS